MNTPIRELNAQMQGSLRAALLDYLNEIEPNRKTNKSYASEAFYMLRNDIGCSLFDVIAGRVSLEDCKKMMREHCAKRGQCNSMGNAYLYHRSIKYLKQFIDERYGSLEAFFDGAEQKTERIGQMNARQRELLQNSGTDVDGAIYRFGGNESVYVTCLYSFMKDGSMAEFRDYAASGAWGKACTAVHTLKGIAGNMGFEPLMRIAAQIVVLLREGHIPEAQEKIPELESCYGDITEAIRGFQALAESDQA